MYSPVLVLDIETKIDVVSGRLLYDLDLNEQESEQALIKIRRQETGQDFQRLALHEIICISGLWFRDGELKLFSWTQANYTEAEILQKLFRVFDKYQKFNPKLITWNGSQFDLPLLMMRAMIHGLSSPYLWDSGELFSQKRYQNYLNRYHQQHIDLMDNLAIFHQKHFAKLDDIARILGFAGKDNHIDLNQCRIEQDWANISEYCESDVLNTWLIYVRWLLLKGQLNLAGHDELVMMTLYYVQQLPQHQDFITRWQKNAQHQAFSQRFFAE